MRLGHEVHLLSQERHPEQHAFVDAAGDWDAGRAARVRAAGRARAPAGAGRCTVYRPDIGGLLPVYVADRYEGIEARTFAELQRRGGRRATSTPTWRPCASCVERVRPELALANHLVMGPVILARALARRGALRGEGARQRARVHGQARTRSASCGLAREGLAGAARVLVGSRHTAASLWEALGDPRAAGAHPAGPAGRRRRALRAPRAPAAAAAGVRALAQPPARRGVAPRRRRARAPSPATSAPPREALARLEPGQRPAGGVRRQADRQQGRRPAARGLAAGARARAAGAAGGGRLRRLPRGAASACARRCGAAISSRRGRSRAPAARSRARRRGAAPLRHLLAFLDGLAGRAARALPGRRRARCAERVVFTGRLEHEELAELLPACEALVVPSTFPSPSGWSPPRRPPAGCCRSAPPTRGWRR